MVETNSPNELENVGQTYQAYKRIVDYCEKYPEAKGKVNVRFFLYVSHI